MPTTNKTTSQKQKDREDKILTLLMGLAFSAIAVFVTILSCKTYQDLDRFETFVSQELGKNREYVDTQLVYTNISTYGLVSTLSSTNYKIARILCISQSDDCDVKLPATLPMLPTSLPTLPALETLPSALPKLDKLPAPPKSKNIKSERG